MYMYMYMVVSHLLSDPNTHTNRQATKTKQKKHVELQTVTNLPQLRATQMLNPVPSSTFSEFSHCDDHVAIAPQKT